jgi:hypothetical protein
MLLIGYVHPGMLHQEFAQCLIDLYSHDSSAKGRHIIGGQCHVRGLYVADSRNQVCRRFLSAKFPDGSQPEWLLFLDTDIVFKPEQVYQLLDAADPDERAVVGGMYFGYLDGAPTPVWRKLYNDEQFHNEWGTLNVVNIGTIEKVDAVGMGFTLIHRNVLTKMAEVYADDDWTWFGHDKWGRLHLGEDLTFCHRAAQVGYPTYGDSRNIVGHIKPLTIGLGHFQQHQERIAHAQATAQAAGAA